MKQTVQDLLSFSLSVFLGVLGHCSLSWEWEKILSNDGLDLFDVDVSVYIGKPGFRDPSTSRVREENTFKKLKLWKCGFTSTQTFKTITAFLVLKFVVGPSCHWCRFLYFAGVVCRSSTIHSSHVAFSRPCRLPEFTPNRVSQSGERPVVTKSYHQTHCRKVYHRCGFLLLRDCCHTSCQNIFHYSMVYIEAYWCAAVQNVDKDSGILFGGVYTSTEPNPVTGLQSCPHRLYAMPFGSHSHVCLSDDYELGCQFAFTFCRIFQLFIWQSSRCASQENPGKEWQDRTASLPCRTFTWRRWRRNIKRPTELPPRLQSAPHGCR